MNTLRKRLITFGRFELARIRAQERGYGPGAWVHASSREMVMGLDPQQFETLIVGPSLDAQATEALKEWEFRRMLILGPSSPPQP